MKRSTAIILGASGVILGAAWLGSSSPEPETEASIYANVAECINAGVLSRDTCETEFAAARENHTTRAPRFTGQRDCEAQYGSGSCQPATIAGTSYFIPAMAGFLVATHLANRRQAQALLPPLTSQQTCAPGQTPQTQPGCVVRSSGGSSSAGGWRSFSTSSGYAVNRSSAASPRVTLPSSVTTLPSPRTSTGPVTARTPSASSSTVSRGGFGSTGRSVSSSSS
jgi:uncharacterized protein YgiB involved in biofilm formation